MGLGAWRLGRRRCEAKLRLAGCFGCTVKCRYMGHLLPVSRRRSSKLTSFQCEFNSLNLEIGALQAKKTFCHTFQLSRGFLLAPSSSSYNETVKPAKSTMNKQCV